jgi:hypothetical protein
MEIGFDNPEYSDAKVVLTTESADSFRARTAAAMSPEPCSPATAEHSAEGSAASGAGLAVEEVQVTKLVLCASSKYFDAAFKWAHSSSSNPGASRKRPREVPPVVVLSLADEALFPTARTMLLFMYTHKLPPGLHRTELMQLIRLADQYAVPQLRLACVRKLYQTPLRVWAPAEMKLLCEVAAIVANDCLSGGKLAAAASGMVSRLAAHFTRLEDVWGSSEQRAAFCSLPYAVVRQILSSPDLVVKSENTVLIAALSWLRSSQGQQAPFKERREVLLQVRLLQLSPWLVAELAQFPETQDLLVLPEARNDDEADAVQQAWAEPRFGGPMSGMTREVAISIRQQDVVEGVLKCRKDRLTSCSKYSTRTFFDGLFWSTGVQYSCEGDQTVNVWAGIRATLAIGADLSWRQQCGLLGYPINCHLTVGDKLVRRPIRMHAAGCLGGWEEHGLDLAEVGRDDDPRAVLKSCFKGGKMTVQATLL